MKRLAVALILAAAAAISSGQQTGGGGVPGGSTGGSSGMTLISTQVASGSGFSVSFTSIPQTFTHLEIRALSASASGPTTLILRFNSDSGNNYVAGYTQNAAGTVSGTAGSISSDAICGLTGASPYFASTRISIPGYSSTTLPKSFVFDSFTADTASTITNMQGGGTYTNGTPAITEIDIYDVAGQISAGSIFSLYGTK